MNKKCKVVMLATDKETEIGLYHDNLYNSTFGAKTNDWNNQHLYILSDDEIKEGDWFWQGFDKKVHQCHKTTDHFIIAVLPDDYPKKICKKIIATTDSSLSLNQCDGCITGAPIDGKNIHRFADKGAMVCQRDKYQLPSIPQSFIEYYVSEYNKGNKIEEVLVEYEIKGWSKHLIEEAHEPKELHQTLKLNSDNTINIKAIKDSWTREEVSGDMQYYMEYIQSNGYVTPMEWLDELKHY
jgi:hypothetical protein